MDNGDEPMHSHQTNNTNAFTNRVLWWIMGLISSLLLLIGGVINAKLERIETRSLANEVAIAGLVQRAVQLDEFTRVIRTEQIDRTLRFADMNNKISITDYTLKTLEGRVATMSERILAINKRLDQRDAKQPVGTQPEPGY